MRKNEFMPVIDWSKYVEVDDMEYARYELGDTLLVRLSHFQPRYFVLRGSKGTKEKQRELVERIFRQLTKESAAIIAKNDRNKIVSHFKKFLTLQEKFPAVCLVELDEFNSGIKDILKILGVADGNKDSTE